MTIEQMQALATATLTASSIEERAAHGRALAQGLSDLLGIGFPCGWRDVEVVEDEENGGHIVRWDDNMEPDEARGIAVELLRKADAADSARAEER